MTSCNQLKNNFFLLLFYIKIAYFVGERIELFIGVYIFMKSAFLFKPESSEKMVKTSKFSRKNKTNKLTSNNKNNQKRINLSLSLIILLFLLFLFDYMFFV